MALIWNRPRCLPHCHLCRGTGRIGVLDIWRISRSMKEHGLGLEAFDTLPLVPGGAPCPKCVGEDEFDDAVHAMSRKWGNPYDAQSSSESDAN